VAAAGERRERAALSLPLPPPRRAGWNVWRADAHVGVGLTPPGRPPACWCTSGNPLACWWPPCLVHAASRPDPDTSVRVAGRRLWAFADAMPAVNPRSF